MKIMQTKKFVSLVTFLILLLLSFLLPMNMATSHSGFAVTAIIAVALTSYLYLYNFSIFVPALFFTLNYLLRPLQLWLVQLTGISFPGLLFLASIPGYLLILFSSPKIKKEITWLQWGKFNRVTGWLSILLVVFSAFALLLWARIVQKDLSAFMSNLPNWRIEWLLLGGCGFAISNALAEEFLARALLWDGFTKIFSRPVMVNLAQALIFSIWHFHGFPGGLVGITMVFIWSLFLGYIRHRSGGLLAPILAHFFADLTIFFILLGIL